MIEETPPETAPTREIPHARFLEILKRVLPFALYGVIFLPSALASFTSRPAGFDFFNSPAFHIQTLLYNSGLIIITLGLIFLSLRKSPVEADLSRPRAKQLLWVLPLLAASYLIAYLIALLTMRFMPERLNREMGSFNRFELIPLLFCSMLSVGYMEELFFRGYLIDALRSYVPVRAAILISTLMFAFGHGYQGEAALVGTFCLGLVFAWGRFKSRSIHVIALTHAIYNSIVIISSAYITIE